MFLITSLHEEIYSFRDLTEKTTVLDVSHMAASSWERISESTIRNCFRHGGFSKDILEETDQLPVPEDLSKEHYEE